VSWKDEFCSCDALRKEEWGTRPQYGLDVCGFCLKPNLKENFVTDDVIAWRKEKNRNHSISSRSSSGSSYLSHILISSIVLASLVIVLTFAVSGIRKSQESLPQEISSPSPSVNSERPQPLGDYFGQTPIQYNFGIGCDRLRAQIYEGTASVFREAATMGEEDGDLDLAMIAYRYADALDNYDKSETFDECNYR
jgi:hypothetical protein